MPLKPKMEPLYELSEEQYSLISDFEKRVYHTHACYMVKIPQYAEKYSCGLYMEQSTYKVFDKRHFTPLTIQNLSNYSMSAYENDHILEIKEESSCPSRCFSLSGMKPFIARIVPNGFRNIDCIISKSQCTFSPYCGSGQQTSFYMGAHIEGGPRQNYPLPKAQANLT